MVHNMAQKIATKMINMNIVELDDRECYIYGLELLLSKMIVLSVIALIALITHLLIPSIIFTFLYLLIRQYTGGFHCQTAEMCIFLSIIIYVIFAVVFKFNLIHSEISLLTASLASYIAIIAFSPLADANKEIDNDEVKKYRKISIFLGSTMLTAILCSFFMNAHSLFVSVSCPLIADAILLIIAILKKGREKL